MKYYIFACFVTKKEIRKKPIKPCTAGVVGVGKKLPIFSCMTNGCKARIRLLRSFFATIPRNAAFWFSI